jgi:signal transduction histidine kinase
LVLAFTIHSFLVLASLPTRNSFTERLSIRSHIVDILWACLFVLLLHNPVLLAPIVLFLLAAAAYRWGLAGTLTTIVALLAAFLLAGAFGVWPDWQFPLVWLSGAHVGTASFCLVAIVGFLMYLRNNHGRQARKLQFEVSSQAAERERMRIARELHDGVIQTLLGAELRLEVVRKREPALPEQTMEDLIRVQTLIRGSLVDMRELLQHWRPLNLRPEDFTDFMAELIRKFQEETGITARFLCECDNIPFPPSVTHELVRIVQEALVNIRKHSGARNVLVRVASKNSEWEFVIEDDGCGFDFIGCLS